MKKKPIWISFVIFIFICLIVQVIGSFWTRETVSTWYPMLLKPSWTPPDWVFGPVWFFLYIIIGIAGWLIYRAQHSHKRTIALIFYSGQLCLNFIWSFLFFSLCSPGLGLIDIILLWIFIILTIFRAFSVSRLAVFLFIPYFIWVTYALTLNIGIWFLNNST